MRIVKKGKNIPEGLKVGKFREYEYNYSILSENCEFDRMKNILPIKSEFTDDSYYYEEDEYIELHDEELDSLLNDIF